METWTWPKRTPQLTDLPDLNKWTEDHEVGLPAIFNQLQRLKKFC